MNWSSKAVLGILALCALPQLASARPYEVFVDVESEEELYDLQVARVIDSETLESLVDLMQRGVDLNSASRKVLYSLPNLSYAQVDNILAYRDEAGRISNPADLVVQGILTEEQLGAIAAFLILVESGQHFPLRGSARLQSRYSSADSGLPASALQLRGTGGTGMGDIRVGLAALNTRLQIGEVRFDPARQALSAEAPKDRPSIPKAYASWEWERYSAIAGTYRIGFGQSLTFDNSGHSDPDGFYGDSDVFRGSELTRDCKESAGELAESPCSARDGYTYVSPDYKTSDSLLGGAASARDIQLGSGILEAHVFTSYQPRSIYQYELYNPAICSDPHSEDPSCRSPDVFRTGTNPLQPSSKFSTQTLPNMYVEKLAGAHVNYSFDRRSHIGMTGYGAGVDWLVEGMELDFQEWSALPYGGSFGAIGVDGAKGFGRTDVFAEITRSFDHMPLDGSLGGGVGGILRTVTGWDKNQLETSIRYYDKTFANPHARASAASDEYEGLRARDEMGVRVQYAGEFGLYSTRSKVDYWQSPSTNTHKLAVFVRGDAKVTDDLDMGVWSEYQDKDLQRNGRDECYSGDDDEIGPDGPLDCAGQKLQLTGRVRFVPAEGMSLNLQYQHELIDDGRYDGKYRQDSSLVGIFTGQFFDRYRLRARSRFLYEDISDNTYLSKNWWSYVDVGVKVRRYDQLRLRYDLVVHLDDRASTDARTPNPEHWFRVEYEAHF